MTSDRYNRTEFEPDLGSTPTMDSSKARQAFRQIIDESMTKGTRLVITRNRRPVAAVVPIRDLERIHENEARLHEKVVSDIRSAPRPSEALSFDEFHESAAHKQREAHRRRRSRSLALDRPFNEVAYDLVGKVLAEKIVEAAAKQAADRVLAHGQVKAAEPVTSSELSNQIAEDIRDSIMELIDNRDRFDEIADAEFDGLQPG